MWSVWTLSCDTLHPYVYTTSDLICSEPKHWFSFATKSALQQFSLFTWQLNSSSSVRQNVMTAFYTPHSQSCEVSVLPSTPTVQRLCFPCLSSLYLFQSDLISHCYSCNTQAGLRTFTLPLPIPPHSFLFGSDDAQITLASNCSPALFFFLISAATQNVAY